MSELNEAQRNKLAARLAMKVDRSDSGQLLPATAAALALGATEGAVARLEALAQALRDERVIVPINVEADPRETGVHANIDPGSCDAADFARVTIDGRDALVAYSSAIELATSRPGARPMTLPFQKVALTALVETGGRVVINPGADAVLMPRSCVAALAQGDQWLPAWRDEELLAQLRERCEGVPAGRALRELRVVPAQEGTLVRVEILIDREILASVGDPRQSVTELVTALQGAQRLIAAGDRIELVPLPV
ncbi:SseB family protein [Schaalia sp. Marseille-Q2122]|uniref:SseB family protein n=1 Tax=Schaalia sp. Marseille-Q2122 TaxID=2736604 RepID=UPI0020CA8A9A|nr:SseB family protein [Schaalia sp. Marseille-Q2122]